MRIDLSRLKGIDRNLILIVVALAAGIGISAWLVNDVSAREKAVDKLAQEVDANKRQVDSLPHQTAEPLTSEQLSEKVSPFFLPVGKEEELREELSRLAAEHHFSNVKIEMKPDDIDPAAKDGDDLFLASFGAKKRVEVSITFQAEYQDAAQFLGALQTLSQHVLVRDTNLNRGDIPTMGARISGTIALRVYQKDS
jgi:hypothetical protein